MAHYDSALPITKRPRWVLPQIARLERGLRTGILLLLLSLFLSLREVLSFSVHAPIGSRVRPPRPRYEQSASNGTWNVKSWFSDEGRWKGAVLPRSSTIGSRGGVYCNGEIINAYKFFSKLRRLKRKKKKCLKYPEIGKGFRKGRGERGKRKKKKKNPRNLERYRDEGNFHNEGSKVYQFPQRQRGPSPIEISLGDNKWAESYNEGTTSSTRPLVRWDNADSLNI